MGKLLSLGIVAVVAGAGWLVLTNGADLDLHGFYNLAGTATKAALELHQDGTYRFCGPSAPCELGKYRVEFGSAGDRIFFYGNAMIKFTAGGWTNVFYDGARCPCIVYDDPDSPVRFEKTGEVPSV